MSAATLIIVWWYSSVVTSQTIPMPSLDRCQKEVAVVLEKHSEGGRGNVMAYCVSQSPFTR